MCEREKGKWEKVEDLEEDTPKRETQVENSSGCNHCEQLGGLTFNLESCPTLLIKVGSNYSFTLVARS